jgi:hypothetical protein
MEGDGMGTEPQRSGNALGRGFVVAGEARSEASAEAVWDTLAHLRTHTIWAGERASKSARLVTLDAPDGAATVGTEFRSEGLDPMGRFRDRSVVTEAIRPTSFEFVTEARLTTKKGHLVDWTLVHRYEVSPEANGCRIRYSIRTTRISDLPGLLVLMKLPVASALMRRLMASAVRASAGRLATCAQERAAIPTT